MFTLEKLVADHYWYFCFNYQSSCRLIFHQLAEISGTFGVTKIQTTALLFIVFYFCVCSSSFGLSSIALATYAVARRADSDKSVGL